MNEPTVTIKMTRTELITLNEMITSFPDEEIPVYVAKLRKDLKGIEERLDEKIREAVNDQRISEESSNGQTEGQSSEGVCVSCDD